MAARSSCGKGSTIGPTEEEVGITEYLWPAVVGFQCRFKERWHDFQVYEIDRQGTELHLDELITPGAVSAELKAASTARREAKAALGPEFAMEPAVEEDVRAALGSVGSEALLTFLRKQNPVDSSQEAPPFTDLDADAVGDGSGSKEARKRAHKSVLEHFGSFLNTETVESDSGARLLRVWMRDAELRVKTSATSADARANSSDAGGRSKGKKGGKGKGKKGKAGKGDRNDSDVKSACDAEAGVAAGGSSEYGTFRREGWPKDRPDYLYFRLYKENCDTAEGVASIARCVGRSTKLFTFAGTKDRRASTVQQVCAYRLPADQLRRTVTHRMWDKRLRICKLEYRAERLYLGDLQGNCFNVALRGVPPASITVEAGANASVVDRAFAAVKAGGFLNYFGLQRFGTRTIRTHHVGIALIGRSWETAVRLILGDESSLPNAMKAEDVSVASKKRPAEGGDLETAAKVARTDSPSRHRENAAKSEVIVDKAEPSANTNENTPFEDGARAAAKEEGQKERIPKWQLIRDAQQLFLQSGDAQKALDAMPRSQHLERCLLGALARQLPHAEALQQLPHQALALYVHAAQGLVWNAVLSRRIRDFGTKPVVGDLVLVEDSSVRRDIERDRRDDDLDAPEGSDSLLNGDECFEDAMEVESGALPSVRILTPQEIETVELKDVVLPLPGSEVEYPAYLRATYESVARELLGISLGDFHDSTLVPLRGAYRVAVVQPSRLEWRSLDAEATRAAAHGALMSSDVSRLLEARGPVGTKVEDSAVVADSTVSEASDSAVIAGAETHHPATSSGKNSEDVSEALPTNGAQPSAAVVFECALPPSAYLTMLLREVTKQFTD